MWLRFKSHSFRCAAPSALAKCLGSQTVPVFMHRGTSRGYSRAREKTHSRVSPRDVEPSETEGNSYMSSNNDLDKSTNPEKTVESNTETVYQVVSDTSPAIANDKPTEELSKMIQQASNEHHEIFTKFLKQVEDDGYIAYAEGSAYTALTQGIPLEPAVLLESSQQTKSDSTSVQTVSEIKANGEGEARDFAESLRREDFLAASKQQVVENENRCGIQEATNPSVTTSQDLSFPQRMDQSINICLHLDDGVTQEVDRIVTRFSQNRPILNNGRANIPVMKGLPAQHWKQYQVFLRFLQFWKAPFYMGRAKPLVTPLGRRWGVIWQIQDSPEIQIIRQVFRRVLQEDLPQYDFPPDSPWESRATITKGISQTDAEEIADLINTAYPDGFDLGLITRFVLVHTIFSFGRIHTTVTQSPEFPLMGVKSIELSHDINERTRIESLWNQTTSQIDHTFFKTSVSDRFYKTAPIRRVPSKDRKRKRNKNKQMPQ